MSDILVGGAPPEAPRNTDGAPTPGPVPGHDSRVQPDHDRRRSAVSLAVAAGLHIAAILVVAIVFAAGPQEQTLPPISVSLLVASSPTPGVEPALAGTAGAADASASVLPAASTGGTGSKAAGDGFVIPTPRAQPSGSNTGSTTGSSFRVAGGSAGGAESLPALQSPVPGATVSASQSGTATGTVGSSVQHSGKGETVGGPSTGTQKPIDYGALDKGIAAGSAGGSGGGKGGATGGAATGGASAGGSASSGSAIVGPDYRVAWDTPDASKGRLLVHPVTPIIPSSGKQGFALSVSVSFTLGPDGLLTGVKVEQSSGYAQVDSAVIRAIRQWRFNGASGAPPITGEVSYKINPD